VVAFGALRRSGARRQRAAVEAVQQTTITAAESARGVTRLAVVPEQGNRQVTPPAELRRRVANLENGTYIADVLSEQDSVLYRWPDRLSNAVRVWVQPTSDVPNWKPEYPEVARTVFEEWSQAGFPLTFTFIFDSTSADIAIRWIDRFPAESGQRIGETERSQSPTSLITNARVAAALHDSTGRVLSPSAVAGILRHEVGHALGLNHSNDKSSVMYRESATSVIGASDRATLRLIYLVPAGSLR
jgi:predicted Zn-dependent protease